jgi:carbon dioxide concentrating mechanism protein CcmN
MIYLPPPQPSLNKDIRVSGDVEIHPTASLASGVILQAGPNQKIIIGADACIGMGAIINAAQGSINIGSGAILGAGVLIIGASKIGNNCCIGTSSTIFQSDVASMMVVEPGSIIGDSSRQLEQDSDKHLKSPSNNSQQAHTNATKQVEKSDFRAVQNYNNTANTSSAIQVKSSAQTPVNQKKEPVVGQLYINELLITLFPHNKTSPPDPWSS